MNRNLLDYFYIAGTIAFTVYGQIILKWRIREHGQLPIDLFEKLKYLILLLLDPIIFSGFISAFLASLAWMAAMTKFELSHAYPFMSMNFIAILLLSGWLLGEPLTLNKILGVSLIVGGTVVASQG